MNSTAKDIVVRLQFVVVPAIPMAPYGEGNKPPNEAFKKLDPNIKKFATTKLLKVPTDMQEVLANEMGIRRGLDHIEFIVDEANGEGEDNGEGDEEDGDEEGEANEESESEEDGFEDDECDEDEE